jgi:hypothetical protein
VLDALARGVDTVSGLAQAVDEPAQAVDAAVTWAVSNGLATRMQLSQGEHIALTESGLASVATQRQLEAAIGPDGEIDIAALTRHTSAAWQAAQQGKAAELARSQAHVLVDDTEREAAVASLQGHYAQGAMDLAEFERRTTLALGAHTRGDLDVATAGLEPATAPRASVLPPGFGLSGPEAFTAMRSVLPPRFGRLSGPDAFSAIRLVLFAVFVMMMLSGGLVSMLVAVRSGR